MMAGPTVVAGVRLGVFDALAAGPRTATELADGLGADPAGLRLLLDALAAVGYLEAVDGRYANLPTASRWLCADSPGGFGTVLELWSAAIAELWGDLAGAVRSGTPGGDFYAWLGKEPAQQARFQGMQRGLAGWLADEVLDLAPLPPTARTLVDVGGGHAYFSAAFCRRYPGLTALVLDLPAALPAGAATVAEHGLADRVELREADLGDPVRLPGCDVLLLFNVVHGFPPDRARALVAEAVAALRPGGLALVLDSDPEPPPDRAGGAADHAFRRLFALNLWQTQAGDVYSADTLADWLVAAGCRPPEVRPLGRSPGHLLLTARK
jgi:SAM-dependent methyltransferase